VPKTDLVPAYYPGSAQDGPADLILLRSEARQLKAQDKGYFVSHGTAFQLLGAKPLPPVSTNFGQIRDESASIQPQTMTDYVAGESRAVVAVSAWSHGKEPCPGY
jgi:hypothetical protein